MYSFDHERPDTMGLLIRSQFEFMGLSAGCGAKGVGWRFETGPELTWGVAAQWSGASVDSELKLWKVACETFFASGLHRICSADSATQPCMWHL